MAGALRQHHRQDQRRRIGQRSTDDGRGIPVGIHAQRKNGRDPGSGHVRPARRRQVRPRRLQGLRRPARRGRIGGQRPVRVDGGGGLPRRARSTTWSSSAARRTEQAEGDRQARQKTGTKVTFKPDTEIFPDIDFDYERIVTRCANWPTSTRAWHHFIEDERTGQEGDLPVFQRASSRSSSTSTKARSRCTPRRSTSRRRSRRRRRLQVDIAMQYNDGYNENVLSFANNINT